MPSSFSRRRGHPYRPVDVVDPANRSDRARDYPYVRAWALMLGAHAFYADDQVARARRENAPATATHRDEQTGTWHTVDDVWAAGTRARLGLTPLPLQAPDVDDIAATIADALLHSARLHDLYGLDGVEQTRSGLLHLRLRTGFTLEVTVRSRAIETGDPA